MANFVLVHGAWHGGWCWRDTAAALRAAGHQVFTPTHTGVGERSHQSAENITLETHVRDVCGCIEWEELSDVILVGHSYGGMVITGVADRMADRIRALVYLDAFVPEHGDSLIGLLPKALPPEVSAQFVGGFRGAALEGRSGQMQPIPAEVFGIAAANRAWVDRRCVPQALATFEMPLLLTGEHAKVPRRLYILADGWDPSPFRYFAGKLAGAPGWQVTKLPSSHDVMVDMPKELAAELVRLA
jgi:pimeloyl-ACP methyl ester carboxylesterase